MIHLVCWDELVDSPATFVLGPDQEIIDEEIPRYGRVGVIGRAVYVRAGSSSVKLVRNERLSDGTVIPVVVEPSVDCLV